MVIIILPTIAFIIMNSFEKHMKRSIENELSAYSYSILAVAEVEQAELIMPEALIENQFNVSGSGLYAFISGPASNLWRSQSLLTLNLPNKLPDTLARLSTGDTAFSNIEINGLSLFIYSYAVSFTEGDVSLPMTVHIIKDKKSFLQLISEFKQQLWFGLAILMVIILLLQLVWLMWTLKPLSTLEHEIKAVEQGKAEKLTSLYPKELAKLTTQLNQLLATEQKQRLRYRNALSDLAHSLKTPLAVLQAQSNISAVNQEQINRINSTIDHQLKRAQSAGHSSWLLGIEVKPVLDKLLNTLTKIYHEQEKIVTVKLTGKLIFKGDEADLLELLGNLLDNAYKAAKSTIVLTVNQQSHVLVICIEDDGVGIKPQQITQILERGVRADTYQDGHGVGLAIVRDLVASYQGKLDIGSSSALGGAKFTLTFTDFA
ncbi:ATP-binding protein [Colwellia psychrerythraea]|uniref:histidine kinase n=1 Tax=Colwellia psychrerythraea TaxID=28229 RepID=A0A099L4R9_COLPS|nr:ATP-binding protein [Colwellia psychrerythraea]KGJ96883.1 ATP-binding region ATPase domain protein [Colwellia psychrerythraea]